MKILIALIAALLIPFSAQADDYLQLKMSVWEPVPGHMSSNDNFALTGGQTTLNRGIEFGLAYGGQWDMFGIQGQAGFQWIDAKTFSISNIPLVGMARFRLPINNVTPYAEAGGGMIYMSSTLRPVGTTQVGVLPTYGGGIGIDVYTATKSMMVGLEARYMYVKPVGLSWGSNSTTTVDMSSFIFSANFGWVL
jgi:hypothetical protein